MKQILNNLAIKLIQYPIIPSFLATIVLFGLMQFTIPFSLSLLIFNFALVYWAVRKNNGFMVIK